MHVLTAQVMKFAVRSFMLVCVCVFVWIPLEALWVLAGGYSGGFRKARDVELVKEYEYTRVTGFVAVGIKTIYYMYIAYIKYLCSTAPLHNWVVESLASHSSSITLPTPPPSPSSSFISNQSNQN